MRKQLLNFFILGIMLIASCQKDNQEIVILPKNYTGYVIIIFNQEEGASVKYAGKKRVYEIPQTGILKTQFSDNYGWIGFPTFYYESIDSVKRIPFKVNTRKIPNDAIVAVGGSSGTANKDLEGKETVKFRLFYVGVKDQIEKAYQEAEKLNIVELAE